MKNILTTLLLAFLIVQLPQSGVRAQNVWHDTGKISSGAVLCFSVYSDSLLFAGCDREGLFISSDRGRTWGKVDSFPSIGVCALYKEKDSVLLAGTSNGIYRSDNRGKSWSGPLPGSGGHTVLSIVQSSGGDIVAGCSGKGILVSHNGRTDWRKALDGHTITSLVRATDGTLYCISDNQKILTAKENLDLWCEYPHQLSGKMRLLTLTIDGNSLLAGTDNGIFENSENLGQWGMLTEGKPAEIVVRTIDGNYYYSSFRNGLLSREKNNAGYYVSERRYNGIVTAMDLIDGKTLIIGTNDGSIAVSSQLLPPVAKGPYDSPCFIRIPILVGLKSSGSLGISIEIRPVTFAAFEIIQSISFNLVEGQRSPFQMRGIVYPFPRLGVFAGAGYFHFTGYTKQGMPGNSEYFNSDGSEFFVGYRFPMLFGVEMGWRLSGQPWRVFYPEFTASWARGPAEYQKLSEFYFAISLNLVHF